LKKNLLFNGFFVNLYNDLIGNCKVERSYTLFLILFTVCFLQKAATCNAPVTTAGTVVAGGTTAVVPITATDFTNIGSCGLEIHYDPAIALATNVTIGPGVGGSLDKNLTVPGVIIIGWYTYPAVTLPGNPVIFNISFSKVTSGTTALTWFDNGYSCYYSDGSYNILNDVPQSTYYINGSLTFSGSLVANFSASNTTPLKYSTVQFTDLSTGGPTGWTWSFNRSSVTYVGGTNANSQNPQVQFTEGGLYTVTLVATNTGNTDTEIKVDYIRAGTSGLWTGVTSTDWMTGTNWEDWLVPVSITNVEIPAAALYWPLFTGDLALGTNCMTINMKGASQLTVTGNFTINPGSTLSFSNNGTIKVGGNWTNGGTLTAGLGTIDFTGGNPASIISAGSPAVINYFYNVNITKLNTGLTIPSGVTIHVNGDLLINP
jgi:PKD repeat protein